MSQKKALATTQQLVPAVSRSKVPASLKYPEYKKYVRRDFLFSCAYCTMTEAEAEAIRFTIDHYEPKSARPELENLYENLMYACDQCNTLKGTRCPTQEMRDAGKRFFRADQDVRSEHFEVDGNQLEGVTEVGRFTRVAVDLNRPTLARLRDLRRRLFDSDEYVNEGIAALLSFPIDRLKPEERAQALAAVNKALELAHMFFDNLDEALLYHAKSRALGDDDELTVEELERKKARLRELEGIHPVGAWRGRKSKKKRH
jgi:hypothetical protein